MYISFLKRTFDIIASFVGIMVLFIPSLVVALLIKIDDRGPVLFFQKRSGLNRCPFRIWKFRTMPVGTNAALPTRECPHDYTQMSRLQRFLRKSSIDELPQLVNILKGDMSFVGPRPVICQEQDLIDERDKYGANSILPGLTGWAQINGRDNLDYKTKARLDGEYVHRMSFLFDLKCVFLTVIKVIRHDGFNDKTN